MSTRRLTYTLASAFLVLAATGCGTAGDSNSEAVAWTDQVCGALSGFARAATAQPQVNGADPVATVRGLSEYFTATGTAVEGSITALDAIGPSPVAGGDEYVARLKSALNQIRSGFDTARGQLATVDTSSVQAMSVALPTALAPL